MAASAPSTGAGAFALLAAVCGVSIEPAELIQRFGEGGRFETAQMLRAAKALGLKPRSISAGARQLATMPTPALGRDREGSYFVIGRVALGEDRKIERLLVLRPDRPPPIALTLDDFLALWDGSLVFLARRLAVGDPNRPFGLSWFFDAVFRYRRILIEVLVFSFALQMLALATPLFFQVIVDKVLVHQGLSTLSVVAVGLGIALVFEVVLGGLRAYVFSHTTNRIDVELSASLFRHLLRLPLSYFGARRVGDSVARVRELENIRQFLTGSTLTLVIDLVFGALFLCVIFYYSAVLGWIVTAGGPLYLAISALATPALRERVEEKFRRGSENQSFLVEAVSGIETVKSMAVEPQMQERWEGQLAGYVRAAFRVTSLGVLAGQSAQFVSRATTLALLFFGARLVMREKLTVGELIAVNMLAGQLSGPVLRIAQLWQDFQQVRVSVERVGDILNTPAEPTLGPGAATRRPIQGEITFEAVSFRYQLDTPPVLHALDLNIPAGQILGIVGPSGSGKSTLAKLIQRLQVPELGRLKIDGLDLAMTETDWLRRQVGVVLQDSVLFNGTIRDNIALSDPSMPLERVVAAAELAGAHDFIGALAAGYDAHVGERGLNLSGGQRQRISIARVLAADPRILIFDEATSALDLESELAIQANMRRICHGRTVLVIAHRLTALRDAQRIITLEAGRIVEDGAHAQLLVAGGRYASLWKAQTEAVRAPDPGAPTL